MSVVWDLGPHDLSILSTGWGRTPSSCQATSRGCVLPDTPDVAFIHLTYPSGAIAHVELSWLAPSKLRRTAVVGSERMVVYDDTSTEPVRIFDSGVDIADPETFGEYRLSYRTGDIVSPRVEATEPLSLELLDFCHAIRTGAEPRLVGTDRCGRHPGRRGGRRVARERRHADHDRARLGACRLMGRVLVTGGAGFIGSHLVDALLARGDEVRVLDNFSTGDRRNLLHVAQHIEIVEGDLRSFERVLTAVQGCEVVFHQAALPSVPRSVPGPAQLERGQRDRNAQRSARVARRRGASCDLRLVLLRVRLDRADEVKKETMPVAPLSPYGVAKFAGEAYCSSFHEVYGLETVSLRYFNVFGPRQSPISEYAAVIPNFFAAAFLNERPVVYGDGEQSRDFTYIDNVVAANLAGCRGAPGRGRVFQRCMRRDAHGELAGSTHRTTRGSSPRSNS